VDDEKQFGRGRNSSAEIAAKTGPLEIRREWERFGNLATAKGGWAITWVMVLRSDPLPKQDRATARRFCPTTSNDRSMENPAPMKEDLLWNRYC